MFRTKRGDTLVSTIEEEHGIELNARGDMTLDTLLRERGFDSLTQLLTAYHGRLTTHARKRRIFVSFHQEDRLQVQGFYLMGLNENVEIDFHNASLRDAVQSENGSYVRKVIRDKIHRVSIVLCLVGSGTAWRDWVDWELRVAHELGKGICAVRLKESRGRTPPLIAEFGIPVASWDIQEIIAAIERAAARRS